MYRKRMSDALQESRAFRLVNEVMVFKGGRGMNVSKKDLPVFRAKGWKLKEELEEANMKRLLQALQDKLSKEGGAAGFDDLKKTAKTMGVNLTPDMLKGAPGIKQHRDGDYILEAIVGNPNLSKFLFMYKDSSSPFGGARQQGKLITAKNKSAAEAEFKKALPKAKIVSVKEVGDLYGEEEDLEEGIKPYVSMQRDSKTNKMNYVVLDKDEKEVYRSSDERLATAYLRKNFNKLREDLEEAFSKKDFQKLEQSNDHTEAAKKLIDMFGTSDEKKEMNDIKARHEKTGYISGKDYSRRIQLTNRYYSRLK